ncbi:MAG: hypothetical protein LBN19_01355 [Endomicrobium sp.]|jgi:hypothetical protein|nr:hypothetical protein [Endomicrobium sp.]
MKRLLSALCAIAVSASISFATTPLKLSIWEKTAIPQDDSVNGLEIGIGTYTSEVKGIICSLIYAKTDDCSGWQHAWLITFTELFKGLQTGIINLNSGEISGIQKGFFNKAVSVKGLQIGFINVAENMEGVQIGFINFIKKSPIPIMIIANAKF